MTVEEGVRPHFYSAAPFSATKIPVNYPIQIDEDFAATMEH